MTLQFFLATAKNVNRLKVINTWKESEIFYEGSYGDFSTKMFELDLDKASVTSWEFIDSVLVIGISM